MASEYLKWKYRDVKPDEPIRLTRKEKALNWWHYHKWYVLLGSLIPGALTGLIVGMHLFMGFLLYWSQVFPGWGTVALYLFSGILLRDW